MISCGRCVVSHSCRNRFIDRWSFPSWQIVHVNRRAVGLRRSIASWLLLSAKRRRHMGSSAIHVRPANCLSVRLVAPFAQWTVTIRRRRSTWVAVISIQHTVVKSVFHCTTPSKLERWSTAITGNFRGNEVISVIQWLQRRVRTPWQFSEFTDSDENCWYILPTNCDLSMDLL